MAYIPPPICTTRVLNYKLNIFGAVADNKGHRLISTGVKIVCLTVCMTNAFTLAGNVSL